jgi:hypothetical protein
MIRSLVAAPFLWIGVGFMALGMLFAGIGQVINGEKDEEAKA